MSLVVHPNPRVLWYDLVKEGESSCATPLNIALENYLISLLQRYTDRPQIANNVLEVAFLEAIQKDNLNPAILRDVGDQCLLFTGLFPRRAQKRLVKVSYFVNLGRSAYSAVSHSNDDIFSSLSIQFVSIMDILQAIGCHPELLPLEAFEQWHDLGSRRSFQLLQDYFRILP